jgi:diacylglycerol kinase (ATP)
VGNPGADAAKPGGFDQPVSEFFRSRARAFGYAFTGLWFVMRTQRNAWIHALVSLAVFAVGLWLRLSLRDWAVIVIAVTLVWMAEFINTALEAVVDLASPQQHFLVKVGKDVGAAAVLIAALSSILIGLLILGPPLVDKLQRAFLNYPGIFYP